MVANMYEMKSREIEFQFELLCRERRIQRGLPPQKSFSAPCQTEPCWKDCPWNKRKDGSNGFYNDLDEVLNEGG